jgi:hypothetical protein
MARFYGKVGYVQEIETRPGIFEDQVTERFYYGNVERNASKWTSSGNLNDNTSVSNKISVVADPYAYQHFPYIKYVEWMGALWKVSEIEVERPRLILTMGGVYNGQQT